MAASANLATAPTRQTNSIERLGAQFDETRTALIEKLA
jgi:hypothetical protein